MQRERLNSSPHSGRGLTDAVSGHLQCKPACLFWQVEGHPGRESVAEARHDPTARTGIPGVPESMFTG